MQYERCSTQYNNVCQLRIKRACSRIFYAIFHILGFLSARYRSEPTRTRMVVYPCYIVEDPGSLNILIG